MKDYKINFKQTVNGYVTVEADNKTDAKDVAERLIDNNLMQHLIQSVDGIECDAWEVESVEDY